jgi:hypothetical integral membrane protein (TIGR02206 family)
MKAFFQYESPYRTGVFLHLSFLEAVIPFVVLIILFLFLFFYRTTLSKNIKLQNIIQKSVGFLFLVVYLSHYVLRFIIYGFDTIILPFQLCSISMFLAIVLLFTNNRSIYTFVFITGIIGGLISLFTPIIGYNSLFYRYYQFYTAHILLILTPLYFLLVKGYIPKTKDLWNTFFILQGLFLFMGLFNYIFDTDFMFIFLNPNKITKFPVINYFGGIPYYILLGEIVVVFVFLLLNRVILFIDKNRKIVK